METRAHFVLVGSAVMITVAAALLFVFYMTQQGRGYDEYDVIFTDRVSGLSVGSIVRFNGIQKGEVEDLNIDPADPRIVIARVRVEDDTPIKTDTEAQLELVGFTGLAIIQFVGGSVDAPLLKEVSEADVPRIQADASGLAAVLESGNELIQQANRALSDRNLENIAGVLENLEIATAAIAENRDDVAAVLKNMSAASEDLAAVSKNLSNASAGLEEMFSERGPQAMEDFEALMEQSRALVEELQGIASENRGSLRIFADQGLGQMAPAMAELRSLIRTLDDMLRELERDPQAYLFGENAPRYGAQEK
jgi:phospholipid/cholesterol/gamma-HCH transport system substrate-binding protein